MGGRLGSCRRSNSAYCAAVGAVAAVQVPAADERAGPQRPQQGQLLFNRRLFGMQAQAVGNGVATGLACSAQGLRQLRCVGER